MSEPTFPRNILYNPLILPLYLPSLILAFCQGLLIPVLPLYAKDLGVSYGLVGLVLASQGLGMLLSDIPNGIVLRRLGRKRGMLLGVGCLAFSTVALVWAGSVVEVIVYRLLAGFGWALYSLARHAYIADSVTVGSRGRAIALLGGVFRIGSFTGPIAGGAVAAMYGLRASFLLFGGACVVAMIIVAIFVRVVETPASQASSTSRSLASYFFATLKAQYRTLASAGSGLLFAQTIRAGRVIIIPLYAADVIGLDVQAIGFIVGLASAIDMLLFYPTGLIMDRLGRKYAIVPSFMTQAVGMFFIPFTGNFIGLLLAASLIGIGNGLGSGSMMTLGADLAPPDSRGEFLGMWRLISDAGFTGGPLAVGSAADLFGLQTAAWVMTSSGLMAATIFILLVPETLKKSRRFVKLSWGSG
jgi:MFS family permease